jgi:uncharacterized PurR-regulated membrane protein YhhQ (DUF165 family)
MIASLFSTPLDTTFFFVFLFWPARDAGEKEWAFSFMHIWIAGAFGDYFCHGFQSVCMRMGAIPDI